MHRLNNFTEKAGNNMNDENFRSGTLVVPIPRINEEQIKTLHNSSLEILSDPGILCFNEEAVSFFQRGGCSVESSKQDNAWTVKIPGKVVMDAVESSPSRVVLGAREPANRLILDSQVSRIYFGTGSETNIFLETELADFVAKNNPNISFRLPVYKERRGTVRRLCDSARLCDTLNNVDFFIRNVNVQDEGISSSNKDVNVFFASLLYMTKHVQAGLVDLSSLDDVLRLGEIVADGLYSLQDNPIISFIACLIKSPLQMVEDTTRKVIEIAKRGIPLVISSSPQGGSTAPIQEEGMVALINAEVLAGITLTQLVNPGTPVLYGSVPVRARLDTLHDFYGAPEFIHYNTDCVQMARFYGVPSYSTAGVGDSKVPGIQATVEKLFSQLAVAQSGAQYIHYAFGLLDRTNVFCPVQAILDDANISLVRQILRSPVIEKEMAEASVNEIRKVMSSSTRLFARHIRRQIRRGVVSEPYTLEGKGDQDEVMQNACAKLEKIRNTAGNRLSEEIIDKIYMKVPGLLQRENFEL